MNKFLTIFLIIIIPLNSFGQDEKVSQIISSIAEELADDETDPEAVGIYIEKLNELTENPVRINSADETELSRLFFLTDFQIKTLADYIHSSGRIFSIYEITNIPGFNRELTETILPFIFLNDEKTNHPDSVRFRNNFLTNFSVRYPVSDTSAPGSPFKLLTRYKFTAGHLSGGFTAEKDAGEKFISGNPPFPDFISANLAWTGKGFLRKIIFGDFGARFGMGTSINTGLRTGLSLTQPGYLSGGDEIKSYTSTDENIFFRGLAAQFQVKKTGLSFFLSRNEIDASVDSADNSSGQFVYSFYKSGLHNTDSSIEKKDVLTEYCYGINLVSDFRNLRTGLLWTAGRFSIPVIRTNPDPKNIYDFEGDRYSVSSVYYKAVFGKIVLFGEASSNMNNRFAFIQGLSFRPADRISMNLVYRNYNPGFTAFHGKGLFSSSSGDNVRGVFGNFTFEAAVHLFVTAGCDVRYYPWLKYRCSAPSMAVSREMRIKYIPTDKLTVEAVYSYRFSMLDAQEISGIKKQENISSHSIKGTVRYSPDENLTLSTRIDYKVFKPGLNKGILLLQDISCRFRKIPISVWLRYCIYKTGSWDSRLYTYENDLLYNFSIPVLSGKGSRSCIMIVWKVNKFIDLRIKYGLTNVFGEDDTITETEEFKMQMRIWF
jgi:opacity protein-like surface antigen